MIINVEISTADGEKATVPMMANAATVIRYRSIFHEELQTKITDVVKNLAGSNANVKEEDMLSVFGQLDIDTISKLAYVMNMQAVGQIKQANNEDYIDWVSQYGPIAFIEVAADIIAIYFDQKMGTSNPKKEDAPQIES